MILSVYHCAYIGPVQPSKRMLTRSKSQQIITKMDQLKTLILKRTALFAAINKDFGSFEFTSAIKSEDCSTDVQVFKDMRLIYERTLHLDDGIEHEMTKMKQDKELRETERRIQNHSSLIKVQKYLQNYFDKKSMNRGTTQKTEVTQKRTAARSKLKFYGTFTQWSFFWDSITAVILEAEYADISKFNYIIGQLEGPALEASAGTHPSDENLTTLISLVWFNPL